MNYKPAMRQIEKDINSIKKRSQEDSEAVVKDIKDYKNKIGNDIIDIKKEINLLRVEFMVIKSDLLKEKEFDKVKTSEATSDTQAEEETKDNIAKGYWWW